MEYLYIWKHFKGGGLGISSLNCLFSYHFKRLGCEDGGGNESRNTTLPINKDDLGTRARNYDKLVRPHYI
jgi:hypothetical protein